jgi:hypothetical protein
MLFIYGRNRGSTLVPEKSRDVPARLLGGQRNRAPRCFQQWPRPADPHSQLLLIREGKGRAQADANSFRTQTWETRSLAESGRPSSQSGDGLDPPSSLKPLDPGFQRPDLFSSPEMRSTSRCGRDWFTSSTTAPMTFDLALGLRGANA